MTTKLVEILIAEDIPSDNKGEGALFYGMVETLEPLRPYIIRMLSLNPDNDSTNYKDIVEIIDSRGITPAHILSGLGSTFYKVINYLKFLYKHLLYVGIYKLSKSIAEKFFLHNQWKSYARADIVLLGHDSFWAPLYHGPLLVCFNLMAKPACVYAGTIIPPKGSYLKRRISDVINKSCLKKAKLVTLREKKSEEYLHSLGLNGKMPPIVVYPDLAFAMPAAPGERIDQIMSHEKLEQDLPIVGMAISRRILGYAYPEIPSIDERREKALSVLVDLIDFINEELNALVVFVPHSIGPSSNVDDRIIADRIIKPVKSKEKTISIRNNLTPQELRGLASRMAITVGSRLHFAVDSFCNCVPSLLLTHRNDIRCHGIVGDMLGQKRFLYNVENLDRGLIDLLKCLWNEREDISEALHFNMLRLRKETLMHGKRLKQVYLQNRS